MVVKNRATEERSELTDEEINLGYAKQDYLDHLASKMDWDESQRKSKDELFKAA